MWESRHLLLLWPFTIHFYSPFIFWTLSLLHNTKLNLTDYSLKISWVFFMSSREQISGSERWKHSSLQLPHCSNQLKSCTDDEMLLFMQKNISIAHTFFNNATGFSSFCLSASDSSISFKQEGCFYQTEAFKLIDWVSALPVWATPQKSNNKVFLHNFS